MAVLTINRRGGFSTSRGLWTLPRRMRLSPLDRADNVATTSSPSFNNHNGSYERVSRVGEDGYLVMRRPVMFDADVDPTFDAAWIVDEDQERRLDNKNKL